MRILLCLSLVGPGEGVGDKKKAQYWMRIREGQREHFSALGKNGKKGNKSTVTHCNVMVQACNLSIREADA